MMAEWLQIVNGAAGDNEGFSRQISPTKGYCGCTGGYSHSGDCCSSLFVFGSYSQTGFGELSGTATTLHWRYMLSQSGKVVDELTLPSRRNHVRRPPPAPSRKKLVGRKSKGRHLSRSKFLRKVANLIKAVSNIRAWVCAHTHARAGMC